MANGREHLDWLQWRTRVMCVTARAGGEQQVKYNKVSSTTSALVYEVAVLRQATPSDLKERWRVLYQTQPHSRYQTSRVPKMGDPNYKVPFTST